MKEETLRTLHTGRKMGAIVGGILFVVFGIVPGFYFGSYATIVLLSHLAGGPVEPGIIVRALVLIGILLGLFCTAAVSIVAGSVVGTTLAYVSETVFGAFKARPREAAEEKAK